MIDIGKVCIKLTGREAGKKCVVVDYVDKNFVVIDSPDVKRRRCNIRHLSPTELKLEIKQGSSEEEVRKAFMKAFPDEVKPEKKLKEKPKKMPEPKPEKNKKAKKGGKKH